MTVITAAAIQADEYTHVISMPATNPEHNQNNPPFPARAHQLPRDARQCRAALGRLKCFKCQHQVSPAPPLGSTEKTGAGSNTTTSSLPPLQACVPILPLPRSLSAISEQPHPLLAASNLSFHRVLGLGPGLPPHYRAPIGNESLIP